MDDARSEDDSPPGTDGSEPEVGDDNGETGRGDEGQRLQLLQVAAGISAATIHAHRDTWAFLVEHSSKDRHFRIPGEVKDASDTVLVDLSGPSIVAILATLGDVKDDPDVDLGTRAIAGLVHERIVMAVESIAGALRSDNRADRVRIDFDDRLGPPPEDTHGQRDDEEGGGEQRGGAA
ncbi:hypothetical protein [Streptomyces sp. STR69]|uniref:hypothetical protein n=1 Tax=Streptomyces sp. STR69 TaxID=1796942 RepID=UPI0021C8F3CB|nr:hypothetical protein [Streptomyces sp. STR69]